MSIIAEYYKLGIGLRLKPGELQAIRKSCGQDIDQAFTDVLLAWLRQRYNITKYGPPTWRMLVRAVDSPAGGNNRALAMTISHKHTTDGEEVKSKPLLCHTYDVDQRCRSNFKSDKVRVVPTHYNFNSTVKQTYVASPLNCTESVTLAHCSY